LAALGELATSGGRELPPAKPSKKVVERGDDGIVVRRCPGETQEEAVEV
jgi:hypothetical protein